MIHDHDRSGWFGGSDTAMICGNWKTKTFQRWWMQKLGLRTDHYSNAAMNAGSYFEHAILDCIGAQRKDHQILIPELSLRINLDGDGIGLLYEVKTHSADKPFKVTKAYWQQVQVECFAKQVEEGMLPDAQIVSYGLTAEDYKNFFRAVDQERIGYHPVEYDPDFISEYLRRVQILQRCMLDGVFPT